MFQTLQNRLLLILISFVSCTIFFTVLLYFYILNSEKRYSEFKNKVENINSLILKDVTVLRDFFENETIQSNFFITQHSSVLNKHYILSSKIEKDIVEIDSLQKLNSFELGELSTQLLSEFNTYNNLINTIVKKILIRGFKDYGIEGEMRQYAHELENYQEELGMVNILQLRRHEKDFILRQESEYISKHESLVASVTEILKKNSQISKERKTAILKLLNNYHYSFVTLTQLEKVIGIKSSVGLKKAIDQKVAELENTLQLAISDAYALETNGSARLKTIFLSLLCLLVVISLVSAHLISKRISGSIVNLKEKIAEFIAGDFSKRNILPAKNSHFEIDALANHFSLLEQHILNQMNALRAGNKDLTTLIGKASVDIKQPLLEIKSFNDDILKQSNSFISPDKYLKIEKSWENLLTIVDELSLVKTIKSENTSIERIYLEPLIRYVYNEHKQLPNFNSIIFSLNISLKGEFYSSYDLLKITLFHLLENAIKYSAKRNGHSFIRVDVESQGKFMLKLTITDNGIGIKKEEHARIFDMFYRTMNQIEGTGLGLYIVMNSLEKINGAISVESDESKGSKFTLLLPNMLNLKESRDSIRKKSSEEIDNKHLVLNFI